MLVELELDAGAFDSLDPIACALYIMSAVWAAKNGTNGAVPSNIARHLLPTEWVAHDATATTSAITTLVAAGFWGIAPSGYVVATARGHGS